MTLGTYFQKPATKKHILSGKLDWSLTVSDHQYYLQFNAIYHQSTINVYLSICIY